MKVDSTFTEFATACEFQRAVATPSVGRLNASAGSWKVRKRAPWREREVNEVVAFELSFSSATTSDIFCHLLYIRVTVVLAVMHKNIHRLTSPNRNRSIVSLYRLEISAAATNNAGSLALG